MVRSLVALLAVVALIGLAPAAPVPTHLFPDESYFPTKLGTKWVYELRQGRAARERDYVEVLTGAETKNGTTRVTVCEVEGDRYHPRHKVIISTGAIHRVQRGVVEMAPPLCVLRLPPESGTKWADKLEYGGFKWASKSAVTGTETVTVPAGRFKAVRVECEYRTGGVDFRMVEWYAPNVGIVKRTEGSLEKGAGEDTLALKSFTPGKN